jgi:hypothetical protein
VTPGSAGWLINIGFGEVIIGGSWIKEDLDQLDAIDLGHPVGNDRHYTVYATYTYTDTDPPATAVYASTAGATPPTIPTIPAGAVKLADIFIPTAATSILHASVRIVNAPKAHGPSKVIDTAEILERLIMSNKNTIMFTDGTFTFDGATQELRWTQDLVYQAPVSYNREVYEDVSLVRATLPAGSSPLAIPGGVGSEDAIVYAIIDRSVPNLAAPLVLKVIDLTAASPAELADFYDPLNQTTIITIALIKDGKLHMGGSVGTMPSLPGTPEGQVLAESPLGVAAYQSLEDEWMIGGLRVVPWSTKSYADAAAAAAGLIDASRLKEGMVARMEVGGDIEELAWDGAAWSHHRPTNGSVAGALGCGVVSGCTVSSPAGTTEVVIATGQFVDLTGRVVEIRTPVTVDVTGADGTWIVFWNTDTAAFDQRTLSLGLQREADLPFAVVDKNAGALDKLVDIRRSADPGYNRGDTLTVGGSDNFPTPYHALVHANCYANTLRRPKNMRVSTCFIDLEYTNVNGVDAGFFPGTVTVGTAATGLDKVDGVGTRFKVHYQAGDFILVGGSNQEILTVDSDTLMTLTVNWAAADFAGVAYDRVTAAGPSSLMVDLSQPEFLEADDRLNNVKFIGGPEWHLIGELGTLQWGEPAFPAGGQTAAPLFDFGSPQIVESWTFEDIKFRYTGGINAADSELCIWKNPGKAFEFKRLEIDAAGKLTHIALWSGANINLGGDSGEDLPGTVFDNVNCADGVNPASTSMFSMQGVNGLDGMLSFKTCTLDVEAADYFLDVTDDDAGPYARFDLNLHSCRIRQTGVALVRHNNDAGTESRQFEVRRNMFGGLLQINKIMDKPGKGMNLTSVDLDATIDLEGAGQVTGCRNLLWTTTIPEETQCSNCDFSGGVGAQVNDQVIPLVDTQMVQVLGAMRQSFALDGTAKSRVLYGCELLTASFIQSPTNWWGRPTMSPGAVLMPNGQLAVITSTLVRSLTSNQGAGPAQDDIQNLTPAYTGDQLLYFFVRYNKDVGGGDVAVLRFDQDPPDAYGRPQATLEAGYSVNDYAYVGLLIAETWGGTTALAAGATEDANRRIWENCSVLYTGTGQRTVSPSTVATPGLFQTTNFHGPAITGNGNDDGVIVPSTNHATLNADPFAHAKGYLISLKFEANAGVGDAGTFVLKGNRFYRNFAVSAETAEIVSVEYEVPIRVGDIDSRLVSSGVSGTVTVGTRALIIAVIEDVNSLGGPIMPDSGWPKLDP